MKKDIILLLILASFFCLGISIFDFSDSLPNDITSNKWYNFFENKLEYISFKNDVFKYTIDEKKTPGFEECERYHYNSNNDIIKLNCDKQLVLASFNKENIILNIEGNKKLFIHQ